MNFLNTIRKYIFLWIFQLKIFIGLVFHGFMFKFYKYKIFYVLNSFMTIFYRVKSFTCFVAQNLNNEVKVT